MSELVYIVKRDWNDKYKLFKVAVLKRTEKRITTTRSQGSHYGAAHDPKAFDHYYRATPEEAIAAWRLSLLTEIEVHRERIKELEGALTVEPLPAAEE